MKQLLRTVMQTAQTYSDNFSQTIQRLLFFVQQNKEKTIRLRTRTDCTTHGSTVCLHKCKDDPFYESEIKSSNLILDSNLNGFASAALCVRENTIFFINCLNSNNIRENTGSSSYSHVVHYFFCNY